MSLGDAFSDEIPPSLVKLSTCQKHLTKALATSTASTSSALKNFDDLLEGNTLPPPQEYAEKLSTLEPIIINATSNLEKTLRARQELLSQLQSLVNSNQALLKEEQQKLDDLKTKTTRVLETKIEINDMLAEGQDAPTEESAPTPPAPGGAFNNAPAPEQGEYRPQQFMTDLEAPAYSPISSDSDSDEEGKPTKKREAEESESQTKKAKTDESAPATTTAPTGLEGLDPQVAKFLSSLVGNS